MNKIIDKKIVERKVSGRYYISTVDTYQDSFGRKWEDLRPWDSFRSKEIWEREKETQLIQMKNCGRIN